MSKDKSITTIPSPFELEYDQVNENFRMLADIRFKLLALIPPLGGVAIFLLSQAAVSKQANFSIQPNPNDYALVFLVAWMGFLATLGITFYDQRNTELYNALIGRAKHLEKCLKLFGGQFQSRPPRSRSLLFVMVMGHDTGLALIYGTVLGAWFFPIVYSGLEWLSVKPFNSFKTALLAALIMMLVFIEELLRLDSAFTGLWARILGILLPEASTPNKEIALIKNLAAIRKAIARYAAANGAWPATLQDLVGDGHLKDIPADPVSGKDWCCITEDKAQISKGGAGIVNVRSAASGTLPRRIRLYTNNKGRPYNEW